MKHLIKFGVYVVDTDNQVYVMDDFGTLVPLDNNIDSNYLFRFS